MSERKVFLRAEDIHRQIGPAWPRVLAELGIAEQYLAVRTIGGRNRGKAGPCPACGGTDRYVFDNRNGRGDFFCRQCGAGDGFALLERVHGWSFSEARRQVMAAADLQESTEAPSPAVKRVTAASAEPIGSEPTKSTPTQRVRSIARSVCPVAQCPDAMTYLAGRELWPLPEGCAWRAHPGVDYWDEGRRIGHHPALIAEVRDIAGELVTVHVTYLEGGAKLTAHEPRKLLSPLTGRQRCAVRLMPPSGDTLGIAEGIETALSASVLDDVPVWAALNTSLLAKFEPPAGIERLLIYADRDEAGLFAAARLMERLQGRMRFELRVPVTPNKDFNDQLTSRERGEVIP
jgi:putative DNA primase/helicase